MLNIIFGDADKAVYNKFHYSEQYVMDLSPRLEFVTV